MVRSIVAILVSRGMAIESGVLMQSQANTDAALGFEMDASGRVNKMKQTTEAMEVQYKGLLQQIVTAGSLQDPDTGKPFLPNKDFLDIVVKQFQYLKDELKNENTLNKGILADAHAAVAQCNTDRNTAFAQVLSLQGTMQSERNVHKTCRLDEDAAITDMETKCNAFDTIQNKCDEDQDWYAKFDEDTEENPLKDIVDAATACKGSVDVVTAKADECDDDQDDFKDAYCAYAQELAKVCDTHSLCYSNAKKALDGSVTNIKEL